LALETLGVRALVTIVFGPLILITAWLGGIFFLAVVAIIVGLALYEFYKLGEHKGAHPATVAGIVFGIALCLLFFFQFLSNLWLFFAVVFLFLAVLELFRNQVNPILNVAATLMGIFYIAVPLGCLLLIRETAGADNLGARLVILIFLAIWLCDTAAYILGARLGKHKLFPRVSPNKTIEGTAFGLLFAVLTAYVSHLTFLTDLKLQHAIVIGAICGSIGQVSDLIESLFKRDAAIKDSSSLIPGHGGVLDRFDSELLVTPLILLYLKQFVW